MKRFYFFLFILFVGFAIYWQTDGFLLSKVLSDLPSDSRWKVRSQNLSEVSSILDQEFHYLNKGHQSFVFASEDGRYVVKLINHQRFSNPSWLHLFPLPDMLDTFRQKYLARRENKYRLSFKSFALAMNLLSEETGMIFVQMNRTNHFTKPLVIVDSLGKKYEVDLNSVEFILQKRMKMIYPALQRLLHEKGEGAFNKGLISFLDVIFARTQKGIADDDLDVEINMGMVGTKVYIIDTGRLYHERALQDAEFFEKEIRKSVRYFEKWLEKTYPEKVAFFQSLLNERLKQHHTRSVLK